MPLHARSLTCPPAHKFDFLFVASWFSLLEDQSLL
jgi:hypothetical protein